MPCASCLITRQIMLLIMMASCLVLKYGPKPQFVGILLLMASLDVYLSLRHSTFHWFEFEGTEGRFMGVHMYFWGFLVHLGVIAAVAALMTLFPQVFDFVKNVSRGGRVLNNLQKFTFWFMLFLIVANLVLSFALVGPPPLKGPYPPVYWGWLDTGWNW